MNSEFNSAIELRMNLVDWMELIDDWFKPLFHKYYNSKYIDAEETDVSRNQTSTW